MSEFLYPKHSTITFPDYKENDIEVTFRHEGYLTVRAPKSEPWLDWQENRPDNRPIANKAVITKTSDGLHLTKWNIDRAPGMWRFSEKDDEIYHWSYIPE